MPAEKRLIRFRCGDCSPECMDTEGTSCHGEICALLVVLHTQYVIVTIQLLFRSPRLT